MPVIDIPPDGVVLVVSGGKHGACNVCDRESVVLTVETIHSTDQRGRAKVCFNCFPAVFQQLGAFHDDWHERGRKNWHEDDCNCDDCAE